MSDANDVVFARALHQHDVRGIVVVDIAFQRVAEMPVEGIQGWRCAEVKVFDPGVEHEQVDSASAIEGVIAFLAFQPIGIGPTPESVVTSAAEELVFAAAAECLIRTADLIGQRVVRILRAGKVIAVQIVVAAVADQDVAAQVAPQPIATSTAVQLVTGEEDLVLQSDRRCIDLHGRIGIQEIDPATTV